MPAYKIVINASPLILLFNNDLSFILHEIFQEVIVPKAVRKEIENSSRNDKAAQMVADTKWLNIMLVEALGDIIRWDLGIGETEVLSYAFSNREYIPVLDDNAAKKCAASYGIKTLGTGSVLILAKQKGLIDSVGDTLMKMRNSGMWISDYVMQLLQKKAGE